MPENERRTVEKYLAWKRSGSSNFINVESPHRRFGFVLECSGDEFTCFSCQITDRLLSCMKVNANIYCVHSASFQSLVKGSPEFTQGGRRLLHNIKAIWHDLRRTFATELRGRQVHEYDIADLLGHTIQSVTGTYARSTPEALEDAVNRLTEPRGSVHQFRRRAS